MLFQPNPFLSEQIIRVLGRKPFQTAQQIHVAVGSATRQYSLQAVFKELKKLCSQGVLIHDRPYYAVSLTWTNELGLFLRAIEHTSRTPGYLAHCLPPPEEGAKQKWNFRDLYQLKLFWSQMVALLVKMHPNNILLSWNPHPWFYLTYATHETQLMNTLQATNTKMFKIIGGSYPLDREAEKFWKKPYVETGFARSFYQSNRRLYFSAVADYIVSATLPKSLATSVDELYRTTRNPRALAWADVETLMRQSTRANLQVEYSPRKFRLHAHRFHQYFGI